MIRAVFRLGGDIQEVVVRGKELLFYDNNSRMMTTIDGLKLSREGCIKEFPDLKEDKEWRRKAIERFKEKLKSFKSEMEILNYAKKELENSGYKPLFYQRAGFRPKKFK